MELQLVSKLKRTLFASLLGFALIFANVLTVQAEEVQTQASTPVLTISPWSVPTLHEGEKYGIFPVEWYYDGSFQLPITIDKLTQLLNATSNKLEQLKLSDSGELSISFPFSSHISRDAVIQSLYAVLTQYQLPASFELGSYTPIEYLQKKGIVAGTDQGLELDKPSTVEQAVVMASRLVEFAYDTVDAGGEGLFWKATKGDNTLYLLGSIHIGIPEMYPINKAVRDAYLASDTLWVEANTQTGDPQAMMEFVQAMSYTDGTTIKDHISQETYEKLQRASEKFGLPAQAFDTSKPWVVSNNMSLLSIINSPQEMGQAALLGVDGYFIGKSLLTQKPIHELEGVQFQSDLFSNVPSEQQEKELNALLDTILSESGTNEAAVAFRQMQLDWANGDLESFSQSFESTDEMSDVDSMNRLFGERDKNMADKLAELLDSEGKSTHFVVVGAGHFVIDNMVIDLLKEKGYTVEIVQ